MGVTADYIQWERRVTAVALTGQHCLMFSHTKLVQEALECESLKSQDLARVLEESGVGWGQTQNKTKHGNIQQQKTMTTCKKKKKNLV